MFLASDAPISPNTNGPFDDFWYYPAGTMSSSGLRVGPEQARRLAAVYACVKVISESTAMLPAILYRREDERTKKRATEHPLYNLLRRRPNQWQTAMEWREMMQAHVLLRGNAYSEIVTGDDGEIEALFPLHPDCMKPEILGPGRFRWRYTDKNGGAARILVREEVFHLRGLSADGIVGLSPIEEQRDTIGMGLAAQDYGARYFQNDATPPGWIEHPAHFKDDEAASKFKASWQQSQSGKNRGKTAVLQYGMKYHPIEIKNTDAQFLECALPGTMITMADGSERPVEDLRVGDHVLSWRDGFTTARVAAIGTPPLKPCMTITTARGRQLSVTADHPVLAKRALRTPGGRQDRSPAQFIAAGFLKPGMYVRVGVTTHVNHGADTSGAWLLGALVGNGYIRSGGCGFSGQDPGVIARMNSELGMFGATLRQKDRQCDHEIVTGGVGRLGSPFRSFVNHHGLVGLRSHAKRVPVEIMRGSAASKAAFLAGYLDTDGTVCKRGRLIAWSSVSKPLLEDCRALLASMGVNAAIYLVSQECVREVCGQSCIARATYHLTVCGVENLKRLAQMLPSSHQEKHRRLAGLIAGNASRYRPENWDYDRVVSVERIGNRQAVGVEIEDTHTFVTDGIVSHNSRKFAVEEIARIFRVPPHKIQDLSHATFCLPADVQVFTESGPKSIADVKVGEKVWSVGADKKTVLAPVLRSACTGEDEIIEIKSRARTLRCNSRHRVLVRRETFEPYTGGRGTWVKIDGIKYRRVSRLDWLPAGEIREGDCLVSPIELPDLGGDKAPTRTADASFMESLGMILGDGFFARDHRSGKGKSFGISHAKDAAYLPAYVSAIESSFRACDGPYGMRNGGTVALVAKRRDETTTVFNSTLAYDELERCGIVGTSKTKRVPEWVFGLTRELKLAFIRGYLDADGTVNKQGVIRFVSVNRVMVEQFRHLCMSCGIRVGNVFATEIKSRFDGYGDYVHTLHAFICSDPRMNAEIGTHTPMYRERLDRKISDRKARVVHIYPNEAQRRDRDSSFAYHRVISINKTAREPVYDLEVEGTHSFVANGVVVHNSNVEHLGLQFVTDTLMPWLVRWEQAIDRDLLPAESEDELFVEFLVDALLRGDTKSRYDAYRSGIQAGWLTRNEARTKENMDPLDGLDEPLEPLNMGRAGDERSDERRRETDESDEDREERQPATDQEDRAQLLARAAAERVIRGELAAMRKAYASALGDPESFPDAVEKFYGEHADYVATVMLCDAVTANDWCRHQEAALLHACDQEIETSEAQVPAVLDAWGATAADELVVFVEGTRRIATLPAMIERQTEAQTQSLRETVSAGFDRVAATQSETARVLQAVGGNLERVGEALHESSQAQRDGMAAVQQSQADTAKTLTKIGEGISTVAEVMREVARDQSEKLDAGLSSVAAEIGKPSKPVFDDKGNVIGVQKVDKLENPT